MMAHTVAAQQMEILDFKKQKKGLLNHNHVVTNKQQATIDFKTDEKGFLFMADGKIELQAEENDGMVTLKTPHKTSFIVIKHPEYGQLTWKVPGKGLRKKQHYEAFLLTFSPDKEYKLQKQWVVFEIEPRNVIVTVDSTTLTTMTGKLQYNLPLGKHAYKVESPFYKTEEGFIEVEDTGRMIVPVALQPIYSYLTINTQLEGCKILVDGNFIGNTQATSGHLMEGNHRLTILYNEHCYYDEVIFLGSSEKKKIELTSSVLYPRPMTSKGLKLAGTKKKSAKHDSLQVNASDTIKQNKVVIAPVTISAPDDSTEIWIDREMVGTGKWQGNLPEGFHVVNTRKDGLESRTTNIWIEDETPQQIDLVTPMTAYGLLSVHCNEVGAKVYINGVLSGETPCVIKNLPAGKMCKVKLSLKGFKDKETLVRIIANDLVDVEMTLKRE